MKKIASFIICLTLLMGTTAIADTQVYFEDFTGGLGAWTGPWALDNVIYYSSPQCMTDSPADSYPNNANQYQILNQDIDLVGYIGARVEFYTRWNIETGFDYCYFYISDDGGTNWDLLHTFNGESVADSTWQLHVNDIGGYAGDTVRFRFRLYSDGAYRADGIHIDDFEVIGEDTDISPPLILTDGTTDSTFAPDDYVTSATITDFSGVASASLTYTVDGATTVAPDSVVGDEYWFTIPQQAGGANMEYFISATDNAVPPNSGNTETYFYVAGYGLFYDDGDPEFIYQYAAGDQSATRFSVLGANQLVTGIFRLYTDVNRPLDTVYVEVWADNAGVPGTSIAGPWAVYPQSTLLDPQGWTYVDFRGLGVNVSGDFWLGYTYQDSFPVILGDSPAVTDRSMANTGAGWVAATTDYHIRAVVASGAPDTCMSCSVANYPSRVPREGGTIYWDMTVLNCGSVTVPTVYGEILPTNIDCNGPQYDFNLYKVIGSGLAPGGSFTNYYYFNPDPGTVPYPTFVEVALWSYVGPGPNNYYGACCFEFTFSTEWGRGGSADSWGSSGEWGIVGDGVLPGVTALGQCYPNPFNAATTIPFEIAKSGNVSIKVYNIAGQLVETLVDGSHNAGSHVAYWDASSYSSGVYYYSLETGNQKFVKRMAMIK